MRREKRPQREKTMTKKLNMTTKKQRITTEECKQQWRAFKGPQDAWKHLQTHSDRLQTERTTTKRLKVTRKTQNNKTNICKTVEDTIYTWIDFTPLSLRLSIIAS